MNNDASPIPDLVSNDLRYITCKDLDDTFDEIKQPDVNLTVCPREADARITSFIQDIYASSFRQLNLPVKKSEVRGQIRNALSAYLPTDKKGAEHLIEDMAVLAERFMKLIQRPEASLFLQIVENDACRKFHVDLYPVRLICTYDGPGTQWLPNGQVVRDALGTSNEQIIRDPDAIQQMGAFCIGIMKGDRADHTSAGIVHRSPPIKAQGIKRLVMRLDG